MFSIHGICQDSETIIGKLLKYVVQALMYNVSVKEVGGGGERRGGHASFGRFL